MARIVAFAVLALAAGCAGKGGPSGSPRQMQEIRHLLLAYHNYFDLNHKGPANATEFLGFAQKMGDKEAQLAIQSVQRGDYVLFYGVKLNTLPEGTSNTVLAYQKDVPTAGGPVGMADGVARTMNADEFKAAPKAGK